MDTSVERVSLQREHAIVQAQPQRPRNRDLHTATGVHPDTRFLAVAKALTVQTCTRCQIRLQAADRDRGLQQHVSHARAQGRGVVECVLACGRVLELKGDDDQSGTGGDSLHHTVGRRRGAAEKRRDVGERARREQQKTEQ